MAESTPETAQVPEPRDIWAELYEGDRIVSGSALIWHAPEVPRDVIEREVNHAHGEGWDRLVTEVQHLHYTPRVKWCSRHDSFGCDNEGKRNPGPDCCHTIVLPVWEPINPPGCPVGCGHPAADHGPDGCIHLCDCAWPPPSPGSVESHPLTTPDPTNGSNPTDATGGDPT